MGDDENRRIGKSLSLSCSSRQYNTKVVIIDLFGKSTLSILYHTLPRHTAPLGRRPKKTVIKWPVLPGRVTRYEHGHLALGGSRKNWSK